MSLFTRPHASLLLLSLTGLPQSLQATELNVLVFYQPSYFTELGQSAGLTRLELLFSEANSVFLAQDTDISLNLLDFTPMTSIDDALPYYSSVDEGTGETIGGANDYASLYIFNDGYDEYDVYTKWSPDIVLYLRDYRDEEVTGTAAQNGDYMVLLAQDSDVDNMSFIHYLGHNLGANHEYEAIGETEPVYAHPSTCSNYQTIMYSSFTEEPVLRFSSPNLVIDGQQCGNATSENNLQVIQDNAEIAESWGSEVEPWGQMSFDAQDFYVDENNESIDITVYRDGDLGAPATLKVILSEGSATYGEDYDDAFIDVAFEIGSDNATFTVPVIDDALEESEETLTMVLSYPYMLSEGELTTATLHINSDEVTASSGIVGFNASSYVNDEGGTALIQLIRTEGDAGTATVHLSSSDESAVAGVDYSAIDEDVIFADGQTEMNVSVMLLEDSEYEDTETFTLTLSGEYADSESSTSTVSIVNTTEANSGFFSLEVYQSQESVIYSLFRSDADKVAVSGTLSLYSEGETVIENSANFSEDETMLSGDLLLSESLQEDGGTVQVAFSIEDESIVTETLTIIPLSDSDDGSTGDDEMGNFTLAVVQQEGALTYSLIRSDYGDTAVTGNITFSYSDETSTDIAVSFSESEDTVTGSVALSDSLLNSGGEVSASFSIDGVTSTTTSLSIEALDGSDDDTDIPIEYGEFALTLFQSENIISVTLVRTGHDEIEVTGQVVLEYADEQVDTTSLTFGENVDQVSETLTLSDSLQSTGGEVNVTFSIESDEMVSGTLEVSAWGESQDDDLETSITDDEGSAAGGVTFWGLLAMLCFVGFRRVKRNPD
jgi:hypothetical protein